MNHAALLALIGDLYAQHAAAMKRIVDLEHENAALRGNADARPGT